MTNLEMAQKYFPKAQFDLSRDSYELTDRFEIEWTGESECFVVNENYYDRDVGYVSNPEVFNGNFTECLEFVVKFALGE